MISFLSLAALSLTLLQGALAQDIQVQTPPGVTQCEPTQFKWTGGTAPYFPSIIPAGQTAAPPLKQFPTQNGTDLTWNVDLASGTSFNFAVKDSTGAQQFSSIITVQSSTDSSCVNTAISDSGTPGSGAPTPSGSSGASSTGSSGATTTGSTGSSSSTGSKSGSPTASNTAPASSNTKNAALNNKGNTFAVAGLMGLVGAALF